MKQYLKALAVREENNTTYRTTIGVAFPNKNGGFTLLLNAIPAAVDGQHKIVLQAPKPRDEQPALHD